MLVCKSVGNVYLLCIKAWGSVFISDIYFFGGARGEVEARLLQGIWLALRV